ncbi:unnamed protein product [Alopecurus aequalis]
MDLSQKEGIEGVQFAVTGGQGFVGAALSLELLRRGAQEVRFFDLRASSSWSHQLLDAGVRVFQGDVRNKEDVERLFRDVDCVFHLASYGMSGKEIVHAGQADEVNINGTCNVLDACNEHGVKRLVYVSTHSVVFGGQPIVNGNEELPYFPIDDHVDVYGRSISIAEQLVLKSNGQQTKKGTPVAAGQAYFICDGAPVNTFEFIISPLCRSLGYMVPRVTLDPSVFLAISKIILFVSTLLYPWLDSIWTPQPLILPAEVYEPIILPAEVYELGVTHYFSYLKAKEELGYVPRTSSLEGLAATISYFQERKRRELDGPTIFTWLASLTASLAAFSAACLPPVGPLKWVLAIHLFVFRSILVLRVVLAVVFVLHVVEGIIAWFLARKIDPRNARGWFWQTVALGILSLRFLLKRAMA